MSDESLQNRQQWKPNVKVSYRINAKASNVRQFDASSVDTQRIGLPIGQSPLKPQPGDYSYSGMHDAGELTRPKEGGPMADMISLVLAAKALNDEYITTIIEEERINEINNRMDDNLEDTSSTKIDSIQPHVKKPRNEE